MAKATLPVNFKDDILANGMSGKRRYNMIQNTDGTVSLEDVTDYTQVGSVFGSAQINATNEAVNNAADASKIIDDLDTIKANTQPGYIAGALAVKELNSNLVKYPNVLGFIHSGNTFHYFFLDVSNFDSITIEFTYTGVTQNSFYKLSNSIDIVASADGYTGTGNFTGTKSINLDTSSYKYLAVVSRVDYSGINPTIKIITNNSQMTIALNTNGTQGKFSIDYE